MSNEFNFAGQMGFPLFGAFGSAPAPTETKTEKKKDEKKAAEKKTSAGQMVEGPVICLGSGWTYTYGEEGKTYGAKVVAKALYDAGYTEVAAAGCVYVSPTNKNLLIVKGIGLTGNDDAEVIPKKVEVATGLTKAEYEAKDFTGKDADEVSVRDLAEKYVESYPDFLGCSLKLSRSAKVAVPFFKKKAEINDDQTYRVWSVAETAEVKGSELQGMYGSSDYKVEFYISESGLLFPAYTGVDAKCSVIVTDEDLGLKKAAPKKAVEKYSLPTILYIPTIGVEYEVDASMFGGKEKVTSEQVIEFLKTRHKVFSQSDRKFDVIYDDVTNKISVAILSGKKGAATAAAPFFVSSLTGEIVQNLPLGIFKGFANHGHDMIENVSFEMNLPKIPYSILNGIIADFKRDVTREDIRQIVYDRAKDEYMVFRPVCQCTKTHIDYVFPKLTKSQVLAMTIHSHNTMPAWFSRTDDEDEVITGLYGVIGRLDQNKPQMNFRASLEGCFTPVDADDIFSFSGGHVA